MVHLAGPMLKRVQGWNTDYFEFFAEQHMIRRVHKRPRRTPALPTRGHLAGVSRQRKPAVLQACVAGNLFEGEWRPQGIR